MHAVTIIQHELFFLGASGGNGKTFLLLLLILAKILLKTDITLSNASSTIAATFLQGSTFYPYMTSYYTYI